MGLNDSQIPLVDLKRQHLSIKPEIDNALHSVVDSGQFINGENTKKFEKEFASYVGVKHGIGVASGSDALSLSLQALDLNARKEIITVSFTFTSSVDCIVYNGNVPVFIDVDADSYTIDVTQIENMVTKDTKAILPVHLYGHPVDMTPLKEIADRYDLFVLEDAAQAHGAKYNDRTVGSFGDLSCFSFYPSKNLGAFGDAGMILTDNDAIAHRLRLLREYGQEAKYHHKILGYNRRIDELQAAVLRVKLKHLDSWNSARRLNVNIYNELLEVLKEKNVLKTPIEKKGATHVYHLYVIQMSQRDEVRDYLRKNGISTGIHYPIPIHKQESYASISYRQGKLTNTNDLGKSILSLPMFPELTESEIIRISQSLVDYYL